MYYDQQERIPCTFMRTGTSKAVYFKRSDLPEDPQLRDRILLSVMGSPDPVQIDGMGGAVVSTSKIAIISRSERDDADIDYTYGQVSLTEARIYYNGNCGNCSSGVGPYAVDEGLVTVTEPVTRVRVYNTNTGKILIEDVQVVNGKAAVDGDYKIDGIPGTGSRIDINLRNTVGAFTGRLFPTGNRQDILHIDGLGEVPVTLLDLGNPIIYVHARYVGARGDENRNEINNNKELMERLERIREQGALMIGAIQPGESAAQQSANAPLITFFHEPMDCRDYVTGELIPGDQVNFVARNLYMLKAIDTYTAIGAVNTAVCSIIPGTVLYESSIRRHPETTEILFGNPRGITDTAVKIHEENGEIVVDEAMLRRTARRIMDGMVYVRKSVIHESSSTI